MKILIVGAAHQGKRSYAKKVFCGEEIRFESLHEDIRRLMEHGEDPFETLLGMLDECENWIVVCDEVGCGVVPMDEFSRQYREQVGRVCCELARRANLVIRVTCGLPQALKGRLP